MPQKILFIGIFTSYALLSSLYACKNEEISLSCQAKLLDTHALSAAQTAIPIADNIRLIYTNKTLTHFIKYDPFLHLYLQHSAQHYKHPFIFTKKTSSSLIANSFYSIEKISIRKNQIGLNTLAQVNKPLSLPNVVTDNCCALEGIATPNGIIQKAYLKHFVNATSANYADIGIRLEQKNHTAVVSAVDPFFKNNPFHVGDIILKINQHKIHSASQAMQTILFSKLHQKIKVLYLQNKHKKSATILTQKRLGGGEVSDTFLEHLGFYFDNNFALLRDVKKYHLKKGDTLIKLNGVNIHTQQDIINAFTPNKKNKLLIKRGSFTFYSKINALYRNYSKNDVRIFNKW